MPGPVPESTEVGVHEGYAALQAGWATLELARDIVRVTGADAERYLQGQLSQDVSELAPGGWAWSLVLSPQGKLDALVRLYRVWAAGFPARY